MLFPIFNNSRAPFTTVSADLDQLEWILKYDPVLYHITQAARTGDTRAKARLGATCVGGPYRGLAPDADHGRCIPSHRSHNCNTGYRNTQHIDWESRNGLVLVDIDDINDDIRAVRFLLMQCIPAIAIAWISARGGGLKLAVAVDPIPADSQESHDAWASAYLRVSGLLNRSGYRERSSFRIDRTHAAAHVAILAHDPGAVVREPREQIPWRSGEYERISTGFNVNSRVDSVGNAGLFGRMAVPLVQAGGPQELIRRLPGAAGFRSASMFEFGGRCAQNGYDYLYSRAVATSWAYQTSMVAEYGLEACLRHYDRGYFSTRERLLDIFPATG